MKNIILASASPRRAELLRQIGISFTVMESGAPEDDPENDPVVLAERLALTKAKVIAAKVADGVVIGADTVVCVDNTLLGKPQNPAMAADMLRSLSGRTHQVMTGLAMITCPEGVTLTHVEITHVSMRVISEEEINWYVASKEPFDKAGGYGIQGKAAVFVDKLEGCYFNVVGLPLAALWRMLEQVGIQIWEGAENLDNTAPNHQRFADK